MYSSFCAPLRRGDRWFQGPPIIGVKSRRYWIQQGEEGARSSSLRRPVSLQQWQRCWDEWFIDNYCPKCLLTASQGSWARLSLAQPAPHHLPCPVQCCLQKTLSRGKFQEQLEALQKCQKSCGWVRLAAAWNPLAEKDSASPQAYVMAWQGSTQEKERCSFPPHPSLWQRDAVSHSRDAGSPASA